MSRAAHTAASTPPEGLPGLDPSWSRLVTASDTDGISRTWHVLDNGAEATEGTMLCVHGNPNVLTRDIGTSSLAQGCSGQLTVLQMERFAGNLPPIRAYDPPTPVSVQNEPNHRRA